MINRQGIYVDSPIHNAFGLTYANYYVVPRTMLEQMPYEWQLKWVDLTRQLGEHYDDPRIVHAYDIQSIDINGNRVHDIFQEYRHPLDVNISNVCKTNCKCGL